MAQTPPPIPTGNRPTAESIAQIGGGLTHVFVNAPEEGGTLVFLNGELVQGSTFESLSVEIIAPDDTQEGTLAATLSRYDASGSGTPVGTAIFPGTVELIGQGKRVSITCADPESFDGLFLRFGTGEDGIGMEASGVSKFRMVITPDIHDARLTWEEDGREDVLLV